MTKGKETKQNSRKKVRIKRMKSSRKVRQEVKQNMKQQDTKPSTKVKKGKEKKRSIVACIFGVTFKVLFFTIIAGCIIGVGVVFGVLSSIIGDTEALNIDALKSLKLTTFIYDSEGKEIETLSSENRIMVEYSDLPKHVVDAVISIEDERFLTHNGVDIKRTGKAVIEYVLHGGSSSFGGSTITQQLVKNLTKDDSKSWQRKIREWYRAILLEKEIEKEDIITGYLNVIYMGEGAYGVEAAANTLFAKNVSDVTVAEAACLAAIIQAPESYNPYNGEENRADLLARQQVVLDKMLELGKITKEQYDEAKNQEIVFKKLDTNNTATSYFVDAVIEAVVADLQEKNGVERGVALNMLYNNGYKIYTTQNSKLQSKVTSWYETSSLFGTNYLGQKQQGALVLIDNKTGYVVAISGGAGKKTQTLGFNRATQMLRQSGSSIKPISAYGPAFEKGISYPGLGMDDKYLSVGSWVPKNFTRTYMGYVSVREAIVESLNTCAVRTVMQTGVDYSYNFAKKAGITTLIDGDKNLAALALGAQTNGVRVIDMAATYSAIARGGVYVEPEFYTKVEDNDGNIVLKVESEYKRVMKETTAYLITDCMRSVINSGYVGYSYLWNWKRTMNRNVQIAGKTGTTDNTYDRWLCGFTPYYSIAVWTGYDEKYTLNNQASAETFGEIMTYAHANLPAASFARPSGIITAEVCTLSGLVATEACKLDTRNVVKNEIFASGTIPTEPCKVHVAVEVCEESKKLPTEFCHEYCNLVKKAYIVREEIPSVKTDDWDYMLYDKTPKCTIHKEAKPIENPEENENQTPEGENPINPDIPEGDGTTDVPVGPGEGTENGGGQSPENTPDTNTPEQPTVPDSGGSTGETNTPPVTTE